MNRFWEKLIANANVCTYATTDGQAWSHKTSTAGSYKNYYDKSLNNSFNYKKLILFPLAYLEPSQTSKMELFMKIVNGFQQLIIFQKNSILNV